MHSREKLGCPFTEPWRQVVEHGSMCEAQRSPPQNLHKHLCAESSSHLGGSRLTRLSSSLGPGGCRLFVQQMLCTVDTEVYRSVVSVQESLNA